MSRRTLAARPMRKRRRGHTAPLLSERAAGVSPASAKVLRACPFDGGRDGGRPKASWHQPARARCGLCRYAGPDAHPRFKLERSALHTSSSFVGTMVRIEAQVDRSGERQPLKTAESRRTIELKRHQLARGVPPASAFVFAREHGALMPASLMTSPSSGRVRSEYVGLTFAGTAAPPVDRCALRACR
jgi:hypothetical protein